ncbi:MULTISPECIES: DUF305 domain-containing protein [Prauserella salsuginis group]|uniref:DUF305 domain-containing protein n=1 Tax=Prauserella salsuginis TaxID=387889 RepID=A0ABW6GBE1_9PSEU|nr:MULTISPECIES: DUF305 domain-containing protein [Prauserella salsuginis group]MCR3722896.1 Uncharacterized conserved protein, DUF305 family [Prauserella flava]MCR3737429.1 Uncharacterized conserved protein, DUF305 family [Prauserella salsuginis]
MKSTNVAATAAALTAALVLTGCTGADTSGSTPSSAPADPTTSESGTQASAEHNDADITFARGMIPHHQQAIEMSKLADDRAASPELRRLAAKIEQAQAPEITTLRGFLAAWNAPESGVDHESGGHESGDHESDDHGGMSGMMTGDQMRQLEQSSGAAFDRSFLDMMIAHHEGAVRMAKKHLANGINPEAGELARNIIDTQRAEITEMRGLLD